MKYVQYCIKILLFKMKFPEIPHTWLIGGLMGGLILLRCLGIDSWTTASLSLIIGYMTGKHIEQGNKCSTNTTSPA